MNKYQIFIKEIRKGISIAQTFIFHDFIEIDNIEDENVVRKAIDNINVAIAEYYLEDIDKVSFEMSENSWDK